MGLLYLISEGDVWLDERLLTLTKFWMPDKLRSSSGTGVLSGIRNEPVWTDGAVRAGDF